MQFDEEKVDQEELEADSEQIEPELDEPEERSEPKVVVRRPKATGLWLTVFASVVIILIGGLASYYYYTFQSQGAGNEAQVRDAWQQSVDATEDLTDAFKKVSKWEDMKDRGNESFSVYIDRTSRTIRDVGFDLQNQVGLNLQASTVVSKFAAFIEDYSGYVSELRKIADKIDEIESADELSTMTDAAKTAEEAYDDLLEVNKGFLKGSLPRSVFDIGSKIVEYAKTALDEKEDDEQADDDAKKKANSVVTRFVQGWQDKDEEAMTSLMTVGGKSEFNSAVLEDSSDITGFSISSTTLADDNSKVTVKGAIKKKTPDEQEVSENWQFVLLPSGDQWLVDSFKQ